MTVQVVLDSKRRVLFAGDGNNAADVAHLTSVQGNTRETYATIPNGLAVGVKLATGGTVEQHTDTENDLTKAECKANALQRCRILLNMMPSAWIVNPSGALHTGTALNRYRNTSFWIRSAAKVISHLSGQASVTATVLNQLLVTYETITERDVQQLSSFHFGHAEATWTGYRAVTGGNVTAHFKPTLTNTSSALGTDYDSSTPWNAADATTLSVTMPENWLPEDDHA